MAINREQENSGEERDIEREKYISACFVLAEKDLSPSELQTLHNVFIDHLYEEVFGKEVQISDEERERREKVKNKVRARLEPLLGISKTQEN